MSAIDIKPFPRWPLIAAFFIVGIAIVGATAARFARMDAPTLAMQTEANIAKANAVRTLTFSAALDENGIAYGPITVIDPTNKAVVAELDPDKDGFIHGIMRGLRRSRVIRQEPIDPTLTIARWSDGRVTVTDPATDTMIDLRAFGVDNKAAFERFLPPTPTPRTEAPEQTAEQTAAQAAARAEITQPTPTQTAEVRP